MAQHTNQPRVILLTGVSRGLGRAMIQEFVERGHTVLGCARSADALAELSALHATPHAFWQVDVSRETEVAHWAADVLAHHPLPDLILNNAAVINEPAPLWEVTAEDFSRLVDVNIKGVFHVAKHFLPALVARGSGVIVNFSSAWGRSVSADVAPYCCSKWAIEGLTRALAEDLPDGLAAVPLNPGIICTDMLRTCFGSDAASYPSPAEWARRAAPVLLQLSAADNGKPLSVP